LRRDVGAQHIRGNFDINRARLTCVPHGTIDRLVELANHLICDASGPRYTSDRTQDIDVRNVLQWPHVRLGTRSAAAYQQDRDAREGSIGHRRDGICNSRTRRNHGHPEPAHQFGVRVRHVDRRAFVSCVDDPDALAGDMIPNRLDVTALKSENPIDPPGFKKRAIHAAQECSSAFRSRLPSASLCMVVPTFCCPQPAASIRLMLRSRRTRCKILPVAVLGIS
jgi:hypothetical protein